MVDTVKLKNCLDAIYRVFEKYEPDTDDEKAMEEIKQLVKEYDK